MRLFKIILLALTFELLVFSNSQSASIEESSSNINNFGIDIFKRSKGSGTNDIISPLSIYISLMITLSGAEGETAEEIARTLFIKKDSNKYHSVLRKYNSWFTTLGEKKGFELHLANGLWIAEKYPVLQTFITNARENYSAEIRNADFQNSTESEKKRINSWIAEKTNQKILDALKELNVFTKVLIINALYFKSSWHNQFSKKDTEIKDFYLQGGSKEKVSMMYKTAEKMSYFENEQLQLVCIPYTDTLLEMVIILPKKNTNVENELSDETVRRWIRKSSFHKVKLHLPKFDFKKEYNLKDILQNKGMMPSAFDKSGADFSKISGSKDLFIEDVLHKTYIDVDEMGTEAAAVTIINLIYERMPLQKDQEEIDMNVDHPFYFIIREKMYGGYVFIGKVNNPNLK